MDQHFSLDDLPSSENQSGVGIRGGIPSWIGELAIYCDLIVDMSFSFSSLHDSPASIHAKC
jgi:hypothetical protein